MNADWTAWLTRWTEAGLIDPATADRIRAFEQQAQGSQRLRWPVVIALAFGGLMLGGGILLFVAAHWDALAPSSRFGLVLLMVGGLHVAGAFTSGRFPAMGSTLHAIGTTALGAGIALSGQIFNLEEHWPGGVMMWAVGAGIAVWLLRDIPQIVIFAILAPLWLASEWMEAHGRAFGTTELSVGVLTGGAMALALTYFTAVHTVRPTVVRRALMWTGGLSLPPLAIALAFAAADSWDGTTSPSPTLLGIGVLGAVALPLLVAFALRRTSAWHNIVATVWIAALIAIGQFDSAIALYGWWAIGAVALVAWGVAEARAERINMGAAAFAATVLAFYFSQVMDKLGRSASLIGLGLLVLAGGWALERVRRRLVVEVRGDQ